LGSPVLVLPPALTKASSWMSDRTTAFTCRAGCKERGVSKNPNAGPGK
jgi:hypothetical protein